MHIYYEIFGRKTETISISLSRTKYQRIEMKTFPYSRLQNRLRPLSLKKNCEHRPPHPFLGRYNRYVAKSASALIPTDFVLRHTARTFLYALVLLKLAASIPAVMTPLPSDSFSRPRSITSTKPMSNIFNQCSKQVVLSHNGRD